MTHTPLRLRLVLVIFKSLGYTSVCAFAITCMGALPVQAQGFVPFMGTGSPDAAFSQMDFAQIYLDTQTREQQKSAESRAQRQHLVDTGAVSALDLNASDKALQEYNQAATLMKEQKAKEAIVHLQKAIAAYPKFVLAHNTLGLAYIDQQDPRAREEFETAANLDPKFPGSFFNLGMLALSAKDYQSASLNLEKAAIVTTKDPKTLAALAFAQNGNQQYEKALATAQRVHALDHRGLATVHYIAANAAIQLKDYDAVQRELTTFLAEDPTNPLAPAATKNLDILAKNRALSAASAGGTRTAAAGPAQTFPNSERLKAELKDAGAEPAAETATAATNAAAANTNVASAKPPAGMVPIYGGRVFTIHKAVDETALFFAVSSHGHMVDDLELTNIQILDDSKPPQRVLQFSPQSKLPLRLGLLIDTSGSVQDRFAFEKRAAEKFLQKVLNPSLDLGFVIGFNTDTSVAQDFTADSAALGQGIEKLAIGGGTSLFDAVSFACWKLEAYPETDRVARVLVILTDGEDNSSHRSLKQAIAAAEKAGVTIYTVSTVEKTVYNVSSPLDDSARTDADRIVEVMSERSGGEGIFPGDMQTLDKSLDKLRELIRSRYLVVYRPADFAPNGKFRPVRVTAERSHERMQVHVRKGYDARLEGQPGWQQEGQHWNHASMEYASPEATAQPAAKGNPVP
jgi:Ca-activated chloride channel homolog